MEVYYTCIHVCMSLASIIIAMYATVHVSFTGSYVYSCVLSVNPSIAGRCVHQIAVTVVSEKADNTLYHLHTCTCSNQCFYGAHECRSMIVGLPEHEKWFWTNKSCIYNIARNVGRN